MYEPILKKAGLKVTIPRLQILNLLHQTGQHHWTAEAIHQELLKQKSNVGLATVYRVLTQLESVGIIKRNFFEHDVSCFELEKREHHDHLVCIKCGGVEEFVDHIIEKHQEKIAASFNFQMLDHRLVIYGLCGKCRE